MNGRHVWMIFRKEFTDILRDRKTWIGAVIIPIIIIPFVFFVLASSMSGVEQEAKSYIPLAVVGTPDTGFIQELTHTAGVKIVATNDPTAALKSAKIRAIIKWQQSTGAKLDGDPIIIQVLYDQTNSKSEYARKMIEEKISEYREMLIKKRLVQAGLPISTLEPLTAAYTSVASQAKLTGSMIAGAVTLMMIISLASGGIPAATDLVAGEKERGTLESLISTPVSPKSILAAKLLAVMLMSIVGALSSLFSLTMVAAQFGLGKGDQEIENFNFSFFQPLSVVVFALMIILLSATFASLLIIISTVAKSFKESQTYMAPIVFLGMVPGYMVMPLNPADIPPYYYALPVFSSAAIFKEVFYGELQLLHTAVAIGSALLYVSLFIWLASRFFQREGMLLK